MPRWFSMRLLHVRLPARIADAEDIRAVSVRAATGQIEAQIETCDQRPATRHPAPPRCSVSPRKVCRAQLDVGTRSPHGSTG